MTNDIELRGLEDLARLQRALRAAGVEGKGMRRELHAGLNRATKPIRADLTQQIEPSLPRSGGLASEVKKGTRFATSTKAGRDVAVHIVARGKRRRTLQRASSQGRIWHPVFGRLPGVLQTAGVRSGLLATTFERDKPEVKSEVLSAIARVRSQIYRRI